MLHELRKAIKTEAEEEGTRAAGKQAAGAALIADGLVGLENPLDGKKSRVGILGSLVGIALGILVIFLGFFFGNRMSAGDGDIVVTGRVIDVSSSTNSDGDRMYKPIVEFTDPASGLSYDVAASWSSSSRPTIGSSQRVAYPPGSPAEAKVISGAAKWIKWGGIGIGGLVAGSSFITFLIRLGSIVLGVRLFTQGRKARQEAGDDRGVIETLADSASDVYDAVSANRNAGAAFGTGTIVAPSPASAAPAPAPTPAAAPAPVAPAAWYPDPQGQATLRWWDGSTWTDHTHDGVAKLPT